MVIKNRGNKSGITHLGNRDASIQSKDFSYYMREGKGIKEHL